LQNGKEIFVKSKALRAFDPEASGEDCPTSYSILVQAWLGYSITSQILRKMANFFY
jgi:hypothetical protein